MIFSLKKSPDALIYLPDPDDLTPKKISRVYITSIIATLDPAYIDEEIKYAIERKPNSNKIEDKIEVDPQMLKLLQDYRALQPHRGRKSTGLLKLGAKKRRRPVKPA